MGADADDGVLHFVHGPQQVNGHLLARADALAPRRDADDPVGADQRHEGARAPRHRRGDHCSRNLAELDAQELFLPQGRGRAPAELGGDRTLRRHDPALQRKDQGFDKEPEGQRR